MCVCKCFILPQGLPADIEHKISTEHTTLSFPSLCQSSLRRSWASLYPQLSASLPHRCDSSQQSSTSFSLRSASRKPDLGNTGAAKGPPPRAELETGFLSTAIDPTGTCTSLQPLPTRLCTLLKVIFLLFPHAFFSTPYLHGALSWSLPEGDQHTRAVVGQVV